MALPLSMPRTWLALVPSCTDAVASPAPPTSSPLPSSSSKTSPNHASPHLPSTTRAAAKAVFDHANAPPRHRKSQHRWTFVPLLPPEATVDIRAGSVVSVLGKRSRADHDMRPMQACDVQAVKDLHELTLPVTYSSSYFYSLLSNPHQLCLVATLPAHPSHPGGYFDLDTASSPITPPASPPRSPKISSCLSGKARISKRIIGCVSARLSFEGLEDGCLGADKSKPASATPGIRIQTLCVDPTYRRTGVGSQLLSKMLEMMAPLARIFRSTTSPPDSKVSVSLHVQAPNVVARRFYERHGFKVGSLRRNYYLSLRMKPLETSLRVDALATARKKVGEREREVDAWYLEREVS